MSAGSPGTTPVLTGGATAGRGARGGIVARLRARWPLLLTVAPLGVAVSMAAAPTDWRLAVVALLLTLPTGALVLARHAAAPEQPSPPGQPWDRVTVAAIVALAVMATDVIVWGPRWSPYALALAMLVVVVSVPRSGRFGGPDVLLAPLVAFGLAGSVYGRLFLGQDANCLAFFVPVTVAFVHAWRPLPIGDARAARRLTAALMYVSVAYVALSYVVYVRGWDVLPEDDFQHTRVYFNAMAIVAALLLRRWVVLVAAVGISSVAFLAYPALTWVVVLGAAAAVLTVVFVPIAVLWAIGAAGALVFGASTLTLEQIRVAYFSSVGKVDNTSTREVLLDVGLRRFRESPLVGDLFTANISVPSDLTGPARIVPFHNDYLQFAVSGGILGAFLLVAWCGAGLCLTVATVRSLRRRGLSDQAVLGTVLAAGLIGMFVTAAFNPILVDARNAVVLGILYTLAMSLHLQEGGRACECCRSTTCTRRPSPAART